MRLGGVKKKLYLLTYDKPALNKRALQMQKSFDEVKKMIGVTKGGKK